MDPWRAVDAQNGGIEAQRSRVESVGQWSQMPNALMRSRIRIRIRIKVKTRIRRVHAQTTYNQENLAFCFKLCTVTHFVGFLPLPWFSSSLVVFPYSWFRFGGFFVLCMEKKPTLFLKHMYCTVLHCNTFEIISVSPPSCHTCPPPQLLLQY